MAQSDVLIKSLTPKTGIEEKKHPNEYLKEIQMQNKTHGLFCPHCKHNIIEDAKLVKKRKEAYTIVLWIPLCFLPWFFTNTKVPAKKPKKISVLVGSILLVSVIFVLWNLFFLLHLHVSKVSNDDKPLPPLPQPHPYNDESTHINIDGPDILNDIDIPDVIQEDKNWSRPSQPHPTNNGSYNINIDDALDILKKDRTLPQDVLNDSCENTNVHDILYAEKALSLTPPSDNNVSLQEDKLVPRTLKHGTSSTLPSKQSQSPIDESHVMEDDMKSSLNNRLTLTPLSNNQENRNKDVKPSPPPKKDLDISLSREPLLVSKGSAHVDIDFPEIIQDDKQEPGIGKRGISQVDTNVLDVLEEDTTLHVFPIMSHDDINILSDISDGKYVSPFPPQPHGEVDAQDSLEDSDLHKNKNSGTNTNVHDILCGEKALYPTPRSVHSDNNDNLHIYESHITKDTQEDKDVPHKPESDIVISESSNVNIDVIGVSKEDITLPLSPPISHDDMNVPSDLSGYKNVSQPHGDNLKDLNLHNNENSCSNTSVHDISYGNKSLSPSLLSLYSENNDSSHEDKDFSKEMQEDKHVPHHLEPHRAKSGSSKVSTGVLDVLKEDTTLQVFPPMSHDEINVHSNLSGDKYISSAPTQPHAPMYAQNIYKDGHDNLYGEKTLSPTPPSPHRGKNDNSQEDKDDLEILKGDTPSPLSSEQPQAHIDEFEVIKDDKKSSLNNMLTPTPVSNNQENHTKGLKSSPFHEHEGDVSLSQQPLLMNRGSSHVDISFPEVIQEDKHVAHQPEPHIAKSGSSKLNTDVLDVLEEDTPLQVFPPMSNDGSNAPDDLSDSKYVSPSSLQLHAHIDAQDILKDSNLHSHENSFANTNVHDNLYGEMALSSTPQSQHRDNNDNLHEDKLVPGNLKYEDKKSSMNNILTHTPMSNIQENKNKNVKPSPPPEQEGEVSLLQQLPESLQDDKHIPLEPASGVDNVKSGSSNVNIDVLEVLKEDTTLHVSPVMSHDAINVTGDLIGDKYVSPSPLQPHAGVDAQEVLKDSNLQNNENSYATTNVHDILNGDKHLSPTPPSLHPDNTNSLQEEKLVPGNLKHGTPSPFSSQQPQEHIDESQALKDVKIVSLTNGLTLTPMTNRQENQANDVKISPPHKQEGDIPLSQQQLLVNKSSHEDIDVPEILQDDKHVLHEPEPYTTKSGSSNVNTDVLDVLKEVTTLSFSPLMSHDDINVPSDLSGDKYVFPSPPQPHAHVEAQDVLKDSNQHSNEDSCSNTNIHDNLCGDITLSPTPPSLHRGVGDKLVPENSPHIDEFHVIKDDTNSLNNMLSQTAISNSKDLKRPPSSKNVGAGISLDILKSIVYGGLIESITSLGVVSSAAGFRASSINVVALGLANLFSGLFLIIHNLYGLIMYRPRFQSANNDHMANVVVEDLYQYLLGNRRNVKLHCIVVVVSFILSGVIPPLFYGLSSQRFGNRNYKCAVVLAVSLVSVISLSFAKAYAFEMGKVQTVSEYTGMAIGASALSFITSKLVGNRFRK